MADPAEGVRTAWDDAFASAGAALACAGSDRGDRLRRRNAWLSVLLRSRQLDGLTLDCRRLLQRSRRNRFGERGGRGRGSRLRPRSFGRCLRRIGFGGRRPRRDGQGGRRRGGERRNAGGDSPPSSGARGGGAGVSAAQLQQPEGATLRSAEARAFSIGRAESFERFRVGQGRGRF